jgi:hypothetical protein
MGNNHLRFFKGIMFAIPIAIVLWILFFMGLSLLKGWGIIHAGRSISAFMEWVK